MKKYPKTFAVYYYHFPLISMHPAAATLVQAAHVAESKGHKNVNVVEGLYKAEVDGREPNKQKILDVFNKAQGTDITLLDIATPEVNKHFQYDMNVAQEHMINGTPTVFFDGKKDATKTMYQRAKLIK